MLNKTGGGRCGVDGGREEMQSEEGYHTVLFYLIMIEVFEVPLAYI